ncbi:NUDIX hydrolase [Natronospora cellulosivora (SeqCode)]
MSKEKNNSQEEKTINSQTIYEGNIIKIRKDEVLLSNDNHSEREIVEHSGGVTILALSDDDRILMVEQFRKAAEESLLELPAGKLEKGEDPLECAKRELIEETGFEASNIKHLFSFYTTPGFCDEIIHLYLASNLKNVGINPDDDEILINHSIEKGDIMEMIRDGRIKDAKTIIGLQQYLLGGFDA